MSSEARIRTRTSPYTGPATASVGKRYAWNPNTNSFMTSVLQDKVHGFTRPWVSGEFTSDEKHPGPPFHTGGPFRNLKVTCLQPSGFQGSGTYINKWQGHAPSSWEKYVGGFAPPGDSTFGGFSISNANSLLTSTSSLFPGISSSDREKAWSLSKPRLEKANLFVTIAELRDLPRMLKGTAQAFKDYWSLAEFGRLQRDFLANGHRNQSENILNWEFGWKPFISDMHKMINLVSEAERFIDQISDRNGKPTRRKVAVYNRTSSTKISSGLGNLCLPSSLPTIYYDGSPTWEVQEIVTDSLSASSKWTYYNPLFNKGSKGYNTTLSAIRRHLTVYGLRITPANIYRATPWTWLIDWFSNMSQIIDSASDNFVDEVVCLYMYCTRTRIVERRFIQNLPFRNPGPISLTWSKLYQTKERVPVLSPYGFSLSWDDLSLRQLGILGALGLTRTPKVSG